MANPPQPLRPDFGSLDVESFVHVPGGRELALLRLEGRYRSRLAEPLLEAALLVDDGLAIHRHHTLPQSLDVSPAAGEDEWLWRAAFAVSVAALEDPETAFVLEAGPGIEIELADPNDWQPPLARRAQRRGTVAVGRRAAAAAMLMALAVSPSSGVAEAAALVKPSPAKKGSHAAHPPIMITVHPAATERTGPAVHASSDSSKAPKHADSGSDKPSSGKGSGGDSGSTDSGKGGKSDTPSSHGSDGGQDHSRGPRHHDGHKHHAPRPAHHTPAPSRHSSGGGAPAPSHAPLHHSDGSPTSSNPSFVDALPGPAVHGVPNFVIQKFRVPIFLLPIYQAAGTQYGIRWEVLAAINEIETDYGRNLNVSSAGALGWMQFMPSTWRQYGVDGNKDGKRDPYNPVDAIFAAAKYLKAAGGDKDIKRAIFAYNHAGWYVDSVMLRAKLLAGTPIDVVDSLTGLTEGRFPVAAHARYADDIDEHNAERKVKTGENAANVVNDDASRKSISIFSSEHAPVIASNDGQVKKVGRNKKLGRYVVVQDVYGNRYTYSGLGSVAHYYPVPKKNPGKTGHEARAVSANKGPHPQVVSKPRVFAHPTRPNARKAGGVEQVFDEQAAGGGFSTYSHLFTPNLGLNSKNSTLRKLRAGSHVIAGTLLGRVGRPDSKQAAHMNFGIRPAGKGAPQIDPKPILDGWKLLESTAIYRAKGKNVLKDSHVSIGQILMMPKALLEKRVLQDQRIEIYEGGRNDIRTGQIDRRVLAVLEFLAESGLSPTVSSLKGNHGYLTSSGNVSEHSSGNAVDIAAINGIPILGHQERGGIAEQTVRRLMTLQGTMRPHQIISLLDFGENTLALPDHNNHIHVGFHPMFGNSKKVGKQAQAVLKPGQWTDLIGRLKEIQNPVVPTSPSRYSLPAKPHHRGHGD
ncbi:MAG: lytic murein transglycosylase [Thermoleophilaceae bacterium]